MPAAYGSQHAPVGRGATDFVAPLLGKFVRILYNVRDIILLIENLAPRRVPLRRERR